MGSVLEILPHARGPWLVCAGGVKFAVPVAVGMALEPLAGSLPDPQEIRSCLVGTLPRDDAEAWSDQLSNLLVGEAPRRPARAIRFRISLLPAPLVGRLARCLGPLTDGRHLVILGLIGGVGYGASISGAGPVGFSPDLGSLAGGLGLLLLSAVWHELGHAASLARSGYPPGGIGAGFLFVIPVLYADVTAVSVLTKLRRLRVDAAGVIFQLAAGGLMMASTRLPGCTAFMVSALTLAGSSVLVAVAWSLFPFIRSDGYWLLCDLLGLDDLDQPPRASAPRALRIFLVFYQLANAGFLLLVGFIFPWRVAQLALFLISRAGHSLEPMAANWLTVVLAAAFMGALGIGLARRIGTLAGAALIGLRGLLVSR